MARQFNIPAGEIARVTNLDSGDSVEYSQVLEYEGRRLLMRLGSALPINAVVKVEFPHLLAVGEVAACYKQGDVFSAYFILTQFMHVESDLVRLQSALATKPAVSPSYGGTALPAVPPEVAHRPQVVHP